MRSYSRTKCPLLLPMSLPSFIEITKRHLEKGAKMLFQTNKMAKFANKVPRPLPLPMLLPSFVQMTKIVWGKVQKCDL